jgi:small subunit ribosomal protein S20
MPQHKSCKKRMRTSRKRNEYNRAVKSTVKTHMKKLDAADGENAEATYREIASQLDRAAKKGVIPKKRADRRKSRLAKQVAAKTSA